MAEIRIRRHKPAGEPRRWRGYFTDDGHQYMWLEAADKCTVLGAAVLIAGTGPAWTVIDECPKDWPPLEATGLRSETEEREMADSILRFYGGQVMPLDELTAAQHGPDPVAWGSFYAVKIVMLPDGFPELHLVCSECQDVLERGPAPIPLNRQVMAAYQHEIGKHAGAGR